MLTHLLGLFSITFWNWLNLIGVKLYNRFLMKANNTSKQIGLSMESLDYMEKIAQKYGYWNMLANVLEMKAEDKKREANKASQ